VRDLYTGRLAPRTGLLHLGHAATFWVAHQRAKDRGGRLLLRNEDLDPQRSKQEYVEATLEDLAWLGIEWVPPMVVQSERLGAYREAMARLLREGAAYPCTCSRRELALMVAAPHDDAEDEPVYSGRCRPAVTQGSELRAGTNYRFRVPDGETVSFVDGCAGERSFTAGKDFGDFLVWRKDGLPSYQLACVVDDAAMGVTEVVRGADLLKSTARQMLVQRALGLPTLDYFHTRLLMDADGVRLAKRHDVLALRTLRARGLGPADVRSMFGA
jgi:glutamyl/glutaminyl-tRNA synthetase